MIVRDFITEQRDRHYKNFMFEVYGNKVKLMPVYDYEYSFGTGQVYHDRYCGLFDMMLNYDKVIEYIKGDKYLKFLLYQALKMDINYLIDLLENKGIIVPTEERTRYIDCVEKRKQEIIDSKVLSQFKKWLQFT